MKGNMIFGIYGHNETSISSCMAVPFNDIQPIWNKICINLQKRIHSPQSTKVLLGYVVMYAKISGRLYRGKKRVMFQIS